MSSAAIPGDDAFELMARGGRLVSDKDTAVVMRNLRLAYAQAGKGNLGIALVASDGLVVTCVLPHGANNFLIAAN